MRKLVTGLFMSLDGVVDADDDWQFPYFDEELFDGIEAGMKRAGAALIGRRSFEGYDTLRVEHPESPMVAFLDSIPKYVVSTTLKSVDWADTSVLSGNVREQIVELKREPGADIVVLGSPTLVRWLLANGLLDELSFSVLPIVVGSGVRLFQDMALPGGPVGLELADVKILGSGVMDVTYTPSRA